MKDRQRDPENEKSEASNKAAKGVGKDHAAASAGALRRAGKSLI